MTKTQPWYVTQRAEALAMMHLTRRDDLVVRQSAADQDLLVQLRENGAVTGRMFGVQIKAVESGEAVVRKQRAAVREVLAHQNDLLRDVPFPVCMLFFTLDSDTGYYAWVVEPSDDPAGLRLVRADGCEFHDLDEQGLDRIVEDVEEWYVGRVARRVAK